MKLSEHTEIINHITHEDSRKFWHCQFRVLRQVSWQSFMSGLQNWYKNQQRDSTITEMLSGYTDEDMQSCIGCNRKGTVIVREKMFFF